MATTTLSRIGSRGLNRSLVLRHVLRAGRIARSHIAAGTGLTMGAVSRITQELIAVGLLEPVGAQASAGKPGPRFVELAAAPAGGYVVGVDFKAAVQRALIVDFAGRVIARQQLHFERLSDAHAVVTALGAELEGMIARSGIERARIFGVGVAVVGVVDPVAGVVVDSPIAGWRQVDVSRPLQEALGLPVRVDSMLNALNLAEHRYGLSRDKRNVLLVHTTLGIGASLLADGNVVRGSAMHAGQIAHARLSGASLPCTCGQRGCLTTVGSGHAVLRALRLSPRPSASGNGDLERELAVLTKVLKRASGNHPGSASAVLNAGRALGRFLSALVAFASPEAILLGGTLGRHPGYLWGVREGLREFQPAGRAVEVFATSMGGESAATLLAVEDLVCAQPLDIEPLLRRGKRRRVVGA